MSVTNMHGPATHESLPIPNPQSRITSVRTGLGIRDLGLDVARSRCAEAQITLTRKSPRIPNPQSPITVRVQDSHTEKRISRTRNRDSHTKVCNAQSTGPG